MFCIAYYEKYGSLIFTLGLHGKIREEPLSYIGEMEKTHNLAYDCSYVGIGKGENAGCHRKSYFFSHDPLKPSLPR